MFIFLETPCLVVAAQSCNEWIPIKKIQHEKNLKRSVVFEQQNLRFSFHKNDFFIGKKAVAETISEAINDSSLFYFDHSLINIFVKSMKTERCTDIGFKLTLYCLSITLGDLNL